ISKQGQGFLELPQEHFRDGQVEGGLVAAELVRGRLERFRVQALRVLPAPDLGGSIADLELGKRSEEADAGPLRDRDDVAGHLLDGLILQSREETGRLDLAGS